MYKQIKSKKVRKLILCIAPTGKIKPRLYPKVFKQLLDSIENFNARPLKAADNISQNKPAKIIYCIELRSPANEKRVVAAVEKFHFEVVSY